MFFTATAGNVEGKSSETHFRMVLAEAISIARNLLAGNDVGCRGTSAPDYRNKERRDACSRQWLYSSWRTHQYLRNESHKRRHAGLFPPPPVSCVAGYLLRALDPVGSLASSTLLLAPSARAQFNSLNGRYLSGVHRKSQQRAHEVPSVATAGAWVHMQQAESRVSHNLQNMRVAADEQARTQSADFLPGSSVVIARIPADVGHVDGNAITVPDKIFGKIGTEFGTIHVAVNAPDWPERSETVQNIDRPEIACVPDLVAFAEMAENGVVQKSMCVGEQPDSHSSAYAVYLSHDL